MPRASRFSYLKTDFETTIFGPTASLSPNATYAERQAYRRDVLRLPGPVDRWLLTNIRSPRINFLQDYLMFADVKNEYVICTVEIESETLPSTDHLLECLTTYTLYLKAVASPRCKTNLSLRTSPRAILERFTGLNTELNAPDWTSWEYKTREFQQPTANFASLFVRMANWEENRNQPGLPYKMAQWAKSIMMPVMLATLRYTPSTPPKKRSARQSLPDSNDSTSHVTVLTPQAPKRPRTSRTLSLSQ